MHLLAHIPFQCSPVLMDFTLECNMVTLLRHAQRRTLRALTPVSCGSFAQGLPLSLSGVRRIMDNMDWGEALDFVSFGHVNPDQLDDSDFYILVATQNVVGSPIIHNLIKMVRSSSRISLTISSMAEGMGKARHYKNQYGILLSATRWCLSCLCSNQGPCRRLSHAMSAHHCSGSLHRAQDRHLKVA